MLEMLVSSRIRRALLTHLLTHPTDRFYLRGLAKTLELSVTPLRRELKRLERSGMLTALQEGNMLFYTVNANSAAFLQLKRVGLRAPELSEASSGDLSHEAQTSPVAPNLAIAVASGSTIATELVSQHAVVPTAAVTPSDVRTTSAPMIPVGVVSPPAQPVLWNTPLGGPLLVAASGVGMVLLLVIAGLFYLTFTNQRLASQASRALASRKADVTVMVPPSASGTMHGARWQVAPGGFGGFSSEKNVTEESY